MRAKGDSTKYIEPFTHLFIQQTRDQKAENKMVYNWDDLQERRFEVIEWGDNVRRTRRERLSGNVTSMERKNKLISSAVIVISTVVALAIAVTVALTLVGPMPPPVRGGGADKAEGLGSLPSLTTVKGPIKSPSLLRPTTPPTIAKSQTPSIAASTLPSASPSNLSSMVPSTSSAPTVFCVDEPGSFENHDGEHVTCAWFETVSTYSFVNNCEKTALGRACLFSCRQYNSCVIATVSPSSQPSSTSSPSISRVPTPGPPTTITLLAIGDAMLNEGAPNESLGSSSWLKIIAASTIPAANASLLEQDSNSTITSPYFRDSSNPSVPTSIAAMVRDFSSGNQSIAAMVRDYSRNSTATTTIAPLVTDSSNSTDRGSSARGFIHHSADDGAFHVLIRFNISAYDGARLVSSANLLLTAANSCTSGVYLTQTATNWNEASVTWDNAPSGDGIEVDRLGNITNGQLYSVNVTSVFTIPYRQRQKALSFRLYPLGAEECLFVSKDNRNGGGPKLQIVYDDIQE